METRTKKYMDELKIAKWKNYNQYANNHVTTLNLNGLNTPIKR